MGQRATLALFSAILALLKQPAASRTPMRPFNSYECTIIAMLARDPRRTLWAELDRTTRKSLRRLIAAGKVKVLDFGMRSAAGWPCVHVVTGPAF